MQITSRKFGDFIYFLFALLLVCTSLNIGLNFGGGTTDLSENSIAEAPTNTTYWIDDTTQTALGVDFDNYTLTQDTSASTTTYLIQSETDLAFLSWTIYNDKAYNNHKSGSYFYSDITFKQTRNLDLSAYYWQPIGISYTRDGATAKRYFSGNYDGDGHTVSGVYTPAGTGNGYSYQGLFGYVNTYYTSTNKATIQNVGVIDSFIQGYQYVGGVVGYAASATITNCYNTGAVSGTGSSVGGVVGIIDSGSTIINCFNAGSVSGGDFRVGGVVGYAQISSTITNCYNTGSVSGTGSSVGGVVGSASDSTITNCYNTGSVSGTGGSVGGVVGGASGDVTNCYNTGSVEGTGNYVGGVVGDASGDVTNCYNTGSVEGTDDYVGGIVGDASSDVTNCYNTGSVSGNDRVGGVVGYTYGEVTNCYNTGSVEGTDHVGGVVGYTYGEVTNCYNTGSVEGTSYVGGVVGTLYRNATITNCYNTGSVRGSDNSVGGVVGRTYITSTTSRSYYGGDCTLNKGIGSSSGSGSATKIDAPVEEWAKNEEWYLDSSNWSSPYPWNFETVWSLKVENVPNYVSNCYPYLQSLGMPEHEIIYWTDEVAQEALGVDFDNYSLTKDTSASTTTYLIQSETDLAYLSWTIYTGNAYNNHVSGSYYYSGIYFKQTKNLDLSAYYWQPIGIGYIRDGTSAARYFSGNYDGGGYTVSGVFTPAGSSNGYSYQGLFGCVYGIGSTLASIANLGVIDSFVQGYQYVGGVVGNTSDPTINNVYNTGIVSGSGNYVGGVVGYLDYATISNAYNIGSVSGRSQVGGVVGYTSSRSTVSNVYNTGIVRGTGNYVGGVVGYAYFTNISDCGVECAVITGTSNVGIFVGKKTSATIENCYAIVVDGDLSPYGSNSGTFTNCLWIAGGVKYYLGTDFSGFAWPNADSCPVPKSLSWIGQFWTGDITNEIMASSEWTEWVA